jgi:hypothetical protein
MRQERYNTQWIMQNQLGIVMRSFSEIGRAVATMIDAKRSRHFRTRVRKVNNRAVFEIPEIWDEIMAKRQESRA